jgi:hypothetical protein
MPAGLNLVDRGILAAYFLAAATPLLDQNREAEYADIGTARIEKRDILLSEFCHF